MISRADSPRRNSYFIRTFGCQMNSHDSEHIAGVLEDWGYEPAGNMEDAGVVIFNTCSVRNSAEERVWGQLGAFKRKSSELPLVAVCGCMAERLGTEIINRCPQVNLVFGLDSLRKLPGLLERSLWRHVCVTGNIERARIDGLPSRPAGKARAWVPVSHGCDNLCSYCVVPFVRGRAWSRPKEDITREVRGLVARGVMEVTLLGQNVNGYGRDLDAPVSFSELLESVADTGIRRVKFETSHPADLSDELLRVMSEKDAVCEYLHLPVQSGSNRILGGMKRGYSREYYMERVEAARRKVRGLVVSTDIIVGFPNESDSDFSDTLDLVETVRFDMAYMFIYSRREGTAAAGMKGEPAHDVKLERFNRLNQVQERITAESLAEMVGARLEVLVEGRARRGDLVVGRTRGNRVVLLREGSATEGALVSSVIREAGKHSMKGDATVKVPCETAGSGRRSI